MGMRLWTDKRFWVVFSISRWKGAGRRWRERWLSKINSNWGKHCCCCWFGQKWPSNRIKNDSRICEYPQDCSSSDSKRGYGKEEVVCTFCSTLLDTWVKGRSSHILSDLNENTKILSRSSKILEHQIWRNPSRGSRAVSGGQTDRHRDGRMDGGTGRYV